MMTRRELMQLAAGAVAANGASRVYQLETFDYSGVRLLEGRFRTQFQGARDFYFNIPNDNLLWGFRQRAGLPAPGKSLGGWYGSDTFHAFGQYLSGMSRMAKAANDPALREKVGELIAEWAKTIEPDGYFYYSRKPNSYHYVYEKMVCGLVDAYLYCGNKDAGRHLERITAWAERSLDRARAVPLRGVDFSAQGQEWYTLAENLYRAWQATGEERYRNFAGLWHYADYWGMFNGSAPPDPYGRHAYSHVNTLSSAAMAHAATSEPGYLTTIIRAYDWLQKTQVYATGGFGPGEKLMRPDGSLGKELESNANTFETVCGSWAIFKLGRYLMSFTGQARYGDWMEKALYNGIGAALPMQPDGRNFYYSDYRLHQGRKIYNAKWVWSCCSGTYPQAIADYHNIIYFTGPQALYVNLYVPSEVEWQGVKVRQETAYPEAASSQLTIEAAQPRKFALRLRIPQWCEKASIKVDGQAQPIVCNAGEWAAVDRTWRNNERVSIELPMRVAFAPVDEQHRRRVAAVYGPVVLVKRGDLKLVPFYAMGLDEAYEMYFDMTG